MIGTLGEFEFVASSDMMKTFKDLQISKGARYGQHDTLQGKPKLEYTGRNLDEVKFKLYWRVEDKVNPRKDIEYFEKAMAEGEVLKFMIGDQLVGSGSYLIMDIGEDIIRIDNLGNMLAMEFNLTLKEWVPDRTMDDIVEEYIESFTQPIKDGKLKSEEIASMTTPSKDYTEGLASFLSKQDIDKAMALKNPKELEKAVKKQNERARMRDEIDEALYLLNNEAPDTDLVEVEINSKLKSEIQAISEKRAKDEALTEWRASRERNTNR